VTLPVLPRPHADPPAELRFVVPGDVVPAQMATLLPGGGVATKGKQLGRVRAYRDHVRLRTMMAVNMGRWSSSPDESFAVELRCFVGNARTIDCDNAAKNILDGLKGTCFPDDRQVVDLHVTKQIDREQPRLEVLVRRLP
jgi:Holliday junction resolvase RusA-like endonuclease